MPRYEYKVIPAPRKGDKLRGAKTSEDRFAQTLATLMNKMGREGWDYQRAETLPVEERSGLTGRSTSFQNMLIFRRELESAAETAEGRAATAEPTEPLPKPDSLPLQEVMANAGIRPDPRPEGPRLVSSREDAGGKAPSLGPARGEKPAD